MGLIDSNIPATLKYTDPTFQVLLYVRANIYDMSGASPSLVTSVNLTLIDNGTYAKKHTFTPGTYLVQKLVYTDNTYTTVLEDFPPDNEDVQCLDFASGGATPEQIAAAVLNILPITAELTGEVIEEDSDTDGDVIEDESELDGQLIPNEEGP